MMPTLWRALIHRIFTAVTPFEMQTKLKTGNAQLRLLATSKVQKVVLTDIQLRFIIEVHKFVCLKDQSCKKLCKGLLS